MNADERNERLVAHSPDAMIFADREGLIRVWNAAAERIFGFTGTQAIGASLDIIIPEALRDAHWQGYARAMQAGRTRHVGQALPTKALRADGQVIYVELGFSVIVDATGGAAGALATARDISARFQQERARRKRLQELEQQLAAQQR
ncbi:MAG TPA: PAS domain S-box protein [Spongiibacteraceae bacterium]|nr:PAS domain S-box protein [Spongiibacteraceae bacterium]